MPPAPEVIYLEEQEEPYGTVSNTANWCSYNTLFEASIDNSAGSKSDWKSWQHYKSVSAAPGGTGIPSNMDYGWVKYPIGLCYGPYAYYSGEFGEAGRLNSGLPAFYDYKSDSDFVPLPDGYEAMVATALKSLLPLIKPELSIINSIIELKDFKSLAVSQLKARSLTGLLDKKTRGKILSGWSDMLPLFRTSSRKATLSELVRRSAGDFLQWKFAFAPLISDIGSVYAALRRTERRLNDFITRAGRVQRRHFGFHWNEFVDAAPTTVTTGTGGSYTHGGWWYTPSLISAEVEYTRYTYTSPTTFHAEIEYNYNYTQYQAEHARLLAYLDAFGLNFNPAIIWNAIPWSFVVDWVFGVSKYLNEQRVGNMDPLINIRRFLWSVSRQRQIIVNRKIRIDTDRFGTKGPWITVPLPVVTETAYRRVSGIPSSSSIQSSGLNLNEFSLASALVLARRRRSTRRR